MRLDCPGWAEKQAKPSRVMGNKSNIHEKTGKGREQEVQSDKAFVDYSSSQPEWMELLSDNNLDVNLSVQC